VFTMTVCARYEIWLPRAKQAARVRVVRLVTAALAAATVLFLSGVASAQALPASASQERGAPAAPASQSAPASPWAYGSFYRGFGVLGGRLAGRVGTQLGVTVGKRSFELMLGGLPDNRLLSLGVLVPRFAGSVVSGHAGKLSILWPSGEVHVITDASENLHFNFGLAPCGLSFERALGKAELFFVQLRAPLFALWLPVKVNGAWISRHRGDIYHPVQQASPFLSLGAGLEAGLIL
jgi:hypothetical protein